MLVLSRHRDESIMIGDDVEVVVVDIRGDKARLGIKAPPEIPVHRREIFDAIKREQKATLENQMARLEAHAVKLHNKVGRIQIANLNTLSDEYREDLVKRAAKDLGIE